MSEIAVHPEPGRILQACRTPEEIHGIAARLGPPSSRGSTGFSSFSLLDPTVFDRTRLHGPCQVTDAYLLALAVAHDGRSVTFDRNVPVDAVAGAGPHHIVVL